VTSRSVLEIHLSDSKPDRVVGTIRSDGAAFSIIVSVQGLPLAPTGILLGVSLQEIV
jgi:hypothetical protein